ncbi:MAG: 50S ribosomal protein L10 [Candidatus Latescibacterota bacterium]|nr:MAG: 50S ribosomal protein L10 [Candidatus Latescibacterota bacterium]
MPTPKKVETVATLKRKLDGAQGVVLADFTGLTVEGISRLRREFRKSGSEFYVIKNTLGKIAARDMQMGGLEKFLDHGPTGWAVTTADPTSPAKILMDFARTNNNIPAVKGGYIDGAVLNAEEIKRVANLPPKAVLVAQIMGLVNAPIRGVASTVYAVMASLAVATDEIRKQKEGAGS